MATRTVKVAVSLPKEHFQHIEQLRQELGISRSALIAQAIVQFVEARQKEEDIRCYIEGYQKYPETPAEYAGFEKLALRVLASEEWKE